MTVTSQPWLHPDAPSAVEKLTYTSPVDGREDWVLARRPAAGRAWVVHLHGSGMLPWLDAQLGL